MDIDEKLNKSLDDLIKESEQQKRNSKQKRTSAGRAQSGRGGRRSGNGRRSNDDRMDTDNTPPSGPRAVLKGHGGVQKKKSIRPDKEVPHGNINGKWKHDLHEDAGPVQPRRLDNRNKDGKRGSPEIHRRLLVENVPSTVTKEDMFDLVTAAGSRDQVENITRQPTGHSVKYVIDFMTEKAAYKVYNKYQDVALDDQPVRLRVVGMSMPHTLKSGVKVTKAGQAVRQAGTSVRGRGTQGTMRSDRMME